MFSIRFSDEDRFEEEFGRFAGARCRFVETVLGDYEDRTAAPLGFWNETNYEAQWKKGVERLLGGAENSGLIKRIEDPAGQQQFVDFWELNRVDDDTVVVRSRGWDAPKFGPPLDPSAIYEAVLPFTTKHEGLPPLERRTGVADLADWLSTTRA